jgi:hypothetical protein
MIFRERGQRPRSQCHKEATMSAKKRHVEATTTETGHKFRSTMILLVIAIATFGVWYMVSDRD